jgi:polyisoprenoid-binding protein YceI
LKMQTAAQRGMNLAKYQIDKNAGRFTVQAFATGMLSVFGHNPTIGMRNYEGEIHFVPQTFEKAFVRVTVQTTAMEVLDEMKNDDRKKLEKAMYEDLLESELYPAAVFESKEIAIQKLGTDLFTAHIVGELSFHGVTNTQTFDARVTDLKTMLRISGEFPLSQSDYAVKPISFAAGALRLKDELKFKFELLARAQQ